MKDFFIILAADFIRVTLAFAPFVFSGWFYVVFYERPDEKRLNEIKKMKDGEIKDEIFRQYQLKHLEGIPSGCLQTFAVLILLIFIFQFMALNSYSITRALNQGKSHIFSSEY